MDRFLSWMALPAAALAATIFGGGLTAAPGVNAAESPVVAARVQLMRKGVNAGMKQIVVGLRTGKPQLMLMGAGLLANSADRIPAAFEKKDLSGKTRSKAAIWDNKAEFDGYAKSLVSAVRAFERIARGGDMNETITAIKAIGANCGSCHKLFRKKKKP